MDDFDLDRYLRASKKVDLTGVSWEAIRDHPLPVAEARCLAYMMDIESHTVIFLRDLLATRAAFDPEVTAFLSCWVYEELWHGENLGKFLKRQTANGCGETRPTPPGTPATRGSAGVSVRRDT